MGLITLYNLLALFLHGSSLTLSVHAVSSDRIQHISLTNIYTRTLCMDVHASSCEYTSAFARAHIVYKPRQFVSLYILFSYIISTREHTCTYICLLFIYLLFEYKIFLDSNRRTCELYSRFWAYTSTRTYTTALVSFSYLHVTSITTFMHGQPLLAFPICMSQA
jgi:hypothetical protein